MMPENSEANRTNVNSYCDESGYADGTFAYDDDYSELDIPATPSVMMRTAAYGNDDDSAQDKISVNSSFMDYSYSNNFEEESTIATAAGAGAASHTKYGKLADAASYAGFNSTQADIDIDIESSSEFRPPPLNVADIMLSGDDELEDSRNERRTCVPAWVANASNSIKFVIVMATAMLLASLVLVSITASVSGTTRSNDVSGNNAQSNTFGTVTNAPTPAIAVVTITNNPTSKYPFDTPGGAPATNEPTSAPVTNEPTEAPTTLAPVTNEPTVDDSISAEPTTSPVTNEPTVDDSISAEPTTSPATNEPTVDDSVTTEPTTSPATNEPTVDDSVTTEPSTSPVTNEPTVDDSVTTEPSTSPVTNEPTEAPTTLAPITNEPTVPLTTEPTVIESSYPTTTGVPTSTVSLSPTVVASFLPSSSPSAAPTATANEASFYTISDNRLTADLMTKLGDLPEENGEWLIQLGNWGKSNSTKDCFETDYERVADMYSSSSVPVFFVPGKDEWNNCPDHEASQALWRKTFVDYEDKWDMSWKTRGYEVKRQKNRQENFAFAFKDAVYIGLNMVAGEIHDQSDWDLRLDDNFKWVNENVEKNWDSKLIVMFGSSGLIKKNDRFFGNLEEKAEQWAAEGRDLQFLYVKQNSSKLRLFQGARGMSNLSVVNIESDTWPPTKLSLDTNRHTMKFDDQKWSGGDEHPIDNRD